ncbi:MAG: heavy metal-binding domain-containing protein [Coriobacteriaceae bacterium]|nr:heavy metal-binding domain-containing protein [Coriobacteriaceae bacterium]MDY5372237.1 heavy metal-binding domain-containing protein [Eggerthellaceae bacterium]
MILVKQLAEQLGQTQDLPAVVKCLKYKTPFPYKTTLKGIAIEDEYLPRLEAIFQKAKEKRLALDEERAIIQAEEERLAEIARTMPITSTASFEGYDIIRYGGYVSGDEAIMLSDGFFGSGFSSDAVNNAIKKIRITAIEELKAAAAEIGCNAVVGLDFDYVTVDRQYPGFSGSVKNETYLMLTANGTAVEIEKIKS